MDIQKDFDGLIALLKDEDQNNIIVTELLTHCVVTEIIYSTFDAPSGRTTKNHLLAVYEVRAKIESERVNTLVLGYEQLLPSLRNTQLKHICISTITSEEGSYIIFTDFSKSVFIGILKSKRYLSEIRQRYNEHMRIVAADGVEYKINSRETVLINGQVKSSL